MLSVSVALSLTVVRMRTRLYFAGGAAVNKRMSQIFLLFYQKQGSAQNGWSGGQISLERGHNYQKVHTLLVKVVVIILSVSGGQLALVMAEVTTTNHCGQNTAKVSHSMVDQDRGL